MPVKRKASGQRPVIFFAIALIPVKFIIFASAEHDLCTFVYKYRMAEKGEFTKSREGVTLVDLFAGAGGISEGFLQAYTDTKYYDFLVASDINENCELTHLVRYNLQLGLPTKFLRQDIMEDSFVDNIAKQVGEHQVDVVTGGPSCQSFSLSGRRKKFDKRDDLFVYYLKVIRALKPKYFVMENVKGILTKDEGRVKRRILSEIRSIIDDSQVGLLEDFIKRAYQNEGIFRYNSILGKVRLETVERHEQKKAAEAYFMMLESQFKLITKDIAYKASKSDEDINTVRHGLRILRQGDLRDSIRAQVIALKTRTDVDNDLYGDSMNDFIHTISDGAILERMADSLENMKALGADKVNIDLLKEALSLYVMPLDEVLSLIARDMRGTPAEKEFEYVLSQVRLYNIDDAHTLLSANYGVPQNRERVVFIGCRRDQKLITDIPATVAPNERVTVYEALWDLDMINGGETVTEYKKADGIKAYDPLLIKRLCDGKPCGEGKLYSEWQREGHLSHRFTFDIPNTYVRCESDLKIPHKQLHYTLNNHQTSAQNDTVKARLKMIAEEGELNEGTRVKLKEAGLGTDKRNYTVLNPKGQSPTVVTMPDDFIHYSAYRAMTVREMARLQSFDDSFVFQGKRQTGGEKRKEEIPQFSLVGNAVPPLMARAIANVILENIK